MIFGEINLWFLVLGVVFGAIIVFIIFFLVYKYSKSTKKNYKVHIEEDKNRFEEFNGIFLPLTEINHYRYYYRY